MITCFGATLSFAQDTRGPLDLPTEIQKAVDTMSQELDLNDQQKTDLNQIYTDFFSDLEEEASNNDGNIDDATLIRMNNERKAKVRSVMTDEQYGKFTKMKEEKIEQLQDQYLKDMENQEGMEQENPTEQEQDMMEEEEMDDQE
ncbi:hypothetical protein GCM10023331_03960 [Algivirga pacifica]|uniref:DUF4890 domain-containing protein n=2 Tax=Algivirga pacifica TaxID=1162670 RepID=A0ABP9D2S2_9BACT